ncbi:DUF805 domain-containing protein [Hyphomonas jannaschiana]|uniref:DUF805 domain-containing protein n=1 Tax=Hyphomonas jannaschiana TaxID=86 RepID=UPI0035C781E3
MRGQVLKPDGTDGPGLILGDDGVRYNYTQGQVRGDSALARGQKVDFIGLGDEARDIYALGPAPQAEAPAPDPFVAAAPAAAVQPSYSQTQVPVQTRSAPPAYGSKPQPLAGDGVWTYFIRGITKNYFRFTGRARRQEYWGYTLFNVLTYVVVFILDIVLSAIVYGGDDFVPLLTLLWFLYQIVPSIAVTVRRLHDQDLSGWLYLITWVPYIGWLVIFVFMLIDSRPEPNVHGPSPKYDPSADAFI